jgi:hypothetical protein
MLHRTLPMKARWYAATLLGFAAACGGDETQSNDAHTPVSYTISIDGAPASAPYHFTAGETVLVRIEFLNQAGESLDDVESSHFAGIVIQPNTLATAVRRADHHFQFDVTGGTQGTGTLIVGYGHEDTADEVSFPEAPVTVSSGGGGPKPL